MIIDPIKSPDSSTLKALTSDWNVLIQQLKKNSKSKPDLPPILSHRKSPLQNYKNAIKLHEINSSSHKKTLTQKILDLSRKRKLSTVNLNEQVTRHKRNPSQQLPILTEEEKQLIASKELKHVQKLTQPKGQTIASIKKIDLANAKSIINQFKLFKKQTYQNNSPKTAGRKSPLKEMIKEKRSKPKLVIEQAIKVQQKFNSLVFDGRLSQLVKDENQHNKKLSFLLSHDSKSLKYWYTKQQLQQRRQHQRDSIPSVLKRRRIRQDQRRSSLTRQAHVSVQSQKLIKYPPEQLQSYKTPTAKNRTQLLKKQQGPKQSLKSVIPLKPMPQSHMKQKHYVPKKKISLRTISHNENNSPIVRYEPWDNPEQYLQTIEIEIDHFSFNL